MSKFNNTVRMVRTLYWVVDGASGSTRLNPCTEHEAMQYWDFFFAPHGYVLIELRG